MDREEVEFYSGGEKIKGWFFSAEGDQERSPALVFCPGYGGTKFAAFYVPYVERFVAEGISILLSDFRGWGESGGQRGVIDPFWQIEDLRSGLTYLETRDDIDPKRLGLFGVSFGGGIVSHIAGIDIRVQATVSVSGIADGKWFLSGMRREYEWQEFLAAMDEDRKRRVLTNESRMLEVQGELAIPTPERKVTTVKGAVPEGMVPTHAPMFSADKILDWRPLDVVSRISPRAIMWVYVKNDAAVPNEHSLSMYEAAGQPKRIMELEGTSHYGLYVERFGPIAEAAVEWYAEHLFPPTTPLPKRDGFWK